MFREHAKLFTTLQFVTDLILTCAAFPLSYLTRVNAGNAIPGELEGLLNPALHPFQAYLWMVIPAIGWWAMVAYSLGLYRISITRSGWGRIRIILESSILLGLFLGFLSFALTLNLSRLLIALFVLTQATLLSAARLAVALHSSRRRHSWQPRRNILIVGAGEKAREMGSLISRYSDWGLKILGYVDANGDTDNQEVLGGVSDIPQIIENNVVDELIFVGSEPRDLECFREVLATCKEQGIQTRIAADFFPAKVSKVSMEFLENVPLITFGSAPDHPFSMFVKRVMDVLISSVAADSPGAAHDRDRAADPSDLERSRRLQAGPLRPLRQEIRALQVPEHAGRGRGRLVGNQSISMRWTARFSRCATIRG